MKPISTATHLSWETIKAYLENKLSRTETHTVEEHLLDCPFCAEAFEGLSQAPLAENEENISEIWTKIDTVVNNKKRKRFFIYNYRYWAVAASLLLALGLVLVLLLSNPNFEIGDNAQIAQKNTPKQENKSEESTEPSSAQDLDKNTKSPILEEKTAVEGSENSRKNEIPKGNTNTDENKTAKPVFPKKENPSDTKPNTILEEKTAILADALEEKPAVENKTNAGGGKPVEITNLEKIAVLEEKNTADKSPEKEQKTQKTAVLEEKSKTDANNIKTAKNEQEADLALRSEKDAIKKQNSTNIASKKEAKENTPKSEEQVALDSLSVKKDKETEVIVEKKSVHLPFEIGKLKPNLGVLLDSLKVDFAKIEYKNIPQISQPVEVLSFRDDQNNTAEQVAKVEVVKNAKKDTVQETKLQETSQSETQEVKAELKAEKTEKNQDKTLKISPKDSIETKVQIELPAEAPVSPEGGWDGFQEYLKTNLQYPEDAKRNQVQGMVKIELLIDKESKIKDLEIKRGLIESCNQEAIRLIKNYKWVAARQNGSAVEERIMVRISFE